MYPSCRLDVEFDFRDIYIYREINSVFENLHPQFMRMWDYEIMTIRRLSGQLAKRPFFSVKHIRFTSQKEKEKECKNR